MTSLGAIRGTVHVDALTVNVTRDTPSADVPPETTKNMYHKVASVSMCVLLVVAGVTLGVWAATVDPNTGANTTLPS